LKLSMEFKLTDGTSKVYKQITTMKQFMKIHYKEFNLKLLKELMIL